MMTVKYRCRYCLERVKVHEDEKEFYLHAERSCDIAMITLDTMQETGIFIPGGGALYYVEEI